MIDEALAPLFLFTTIVLRIAGVMVVAAGMDPGTSSAGRGCADLSEPGKTDNCGCRGRLGLAFPLAGIPSGPGHSLSAGLL